MKIEYDFTNKYMKYYNKASGIVFQKNKLKKKTNTKMQSFLSYITLNFALYIIIIAALYIICINLDPQYSNNFIIGGLLLIIFLYFLIIFIFFYQFSKDNFKSKEGVLEINEKGILDKSNDGYQIGIPYKHIELIVITDDLIVFVTRHPIMIMVNNNKSETNKMIDKIKKYSDVQIIDKTKL